MQALEGPAEAGASLLSAPHAAAAAGGGGGPQASQPAGGPAQTAGGAGRSLARVLSGRNDSRNLDAFPPTAQGYISKARVPVHGRFCIACAVFLCRKQSADNWACRGRRAVAASHCWE